LSWRLCVHGASGEARRPTARWYFTKVAVIVNKAEDERSAAKIAKRGEGLDVRCVGTGDGRRQTSRLHVRVDDDLKAQATAELANVGLTVSDAIRILLTRVTREGGCRQGLILPMMRGFGQELEQVQ